MKKKLWTLALAFCLVSAMLPGGVFHAERAWAAATTSVKIGGVELNSDNPYYVNGSAVSDEPQNWTAKFENGTLTLRGLQLTSNNSYAIEAMQGNLTIKLEGENHISRTDSGNVVLVNGDLIISGAGKLTVRDSTDSPNSLIYASGKIEIKEGAVIDAAKTGGSAQTINAHGGNLTVTDSNTSVKAVNHGSVEDSDAIRVDLSSGTGNGTVTVTNGAVLEAETASSNAKAINGDVVATSYTGKIKAGTSKETATAWMDGSTNALNTYKYVRIGEVAPNYLTFTAVDGPATIKFSWENGSDVKISTDSGVNWNNYIAETEITLTNVGDKVSFKGKNVTTDSSNYFTMTGKIAASGSVTSLTDENGNDPDVQLQNGCYKYMFYECENLTTAPELPATNLKDWCYSFMFYNCTSLKTAPTLPAEALANDCYRSMFSGCTSLIEAPTLPAMAIPASAYAYMFYKCTSLTAAPKLLATEIAASGYYDMFAGCTRLTAAPELRATTIDASSYYEMFAGCTSLTTPPPTLPAESLKYWCYNGMFRGCTSLKTVPTISATSLATECFKEMFKDCSKLSISKNEDANHTQEWSINVTGSTTATDWNKDMFKDCTSVDFGSGSKTPQLNATYYVNPNGANSGGTTPASKTITKPTLAEKTFSYQGQTITPTLKFTNLNDKEHVTINGDISKKDVGNYTIRVTPKTGYTWADNSRATLSFSWNITQAGNIYVKVENLTAYVDDTTLPQHKYTITGLLGEDQNQASVTFTYHRIIDATGNAERNESVPDLTREGKYRIDVSRLTIAKADYTQNYTSLNYTAGELEIVKKASTPSGSSGGGYVAPSTDVKTSGSADSKVTSSPSTVQNETRTDASGKQETVAKVTVSAANQREILSQAKANKSKRIIIQIAKTAVQGDAKLELNLDKTFVQSILHDTEASLTIRTADGDKVIAREVLKTLVAQTEGNTVVIDPAAQENPTDPTEPSKAETLAALDSSRLVARSKLVTLKNGKKGIRITWSDKNGAEMNFDGVEIYRSTKKNRFGKKPFYATKGSKSAGYYINSKGIRSGVTYYYKVRGYVLIDGQKHYTDLSLKAIRTVK